MVRLLFALCFLFALAQTSEAGGWKSWLGIHDEDDRDAVRYNGGWPWVAIGKLTNVNGGHCSATLIERDVILTAAHCVSNGGEGLADPRDLAFSAGADKEQSRAVAGIRKIHIDPNLRFTRDGDPETLGLDWAILELDKQLYDGGWLRPVPLASTRRARQAANEGHDIAQAGYSGDQSQNLTRNKRCRPEGLADNGRIILHKCDATFGDSGSPILIENNGDYEIAGVHVAFVRVDGGSFGAAVIPENIPYY